MLLTLGPLAVLSIWEGTTDVMTTDAVKVLKGRASKEVISALDSWFATALSIGSSSVLLEERSIIREAYGRFVIQISIASVEVTMRTGREIIEELGSLICAVLLIADSVRDDDELALELCRRFVSTRLTGKKVWNYSTEVESWDQRIALTHPPRNESIGGSRL